MQINNGMNTEMIIIIIIAGLLLIGAASVAALLIRQKNIAALKRLKEQEALLQDLTKMYNKAVEYDKNKSEFFTNITHELKTPLSVIMGAIQLMEQKDNGCSRQVETMKQNCFRMLRLINNILDLSKVDSGFTTIHERDINLVRYIEELTYSVAPFAEQKGINLNYTAEQDRIITAVDTDKMERVLLNLLSNAIKFTPPGGKVKVAVKGKDRSAEISVSDTGPGIPSEKQLEIFERFKQVGSKATAASEGSGIGLSIAKSFIELMGGNIKVNSSVGSGSEFIVELPLKQGQLNLIPEDQSKHGGKLNDPVKIEFSGT